MSAPTPVGTRKAVRFLEKLFERKRPERVAFQLWDATLWPSNGVRAATILLKHPGALARMFARGTEKGLAEAYIRDDFDVLGDMEAAFEIVEVLSDGGSWRQSLSLAVLLMGMPRKSRLEYGRAPLDSGHARHSIERDRDAISFHYDVSNAFYSLWLDRLMVYSCAYFESPDRDIDSAQIAKLDYLCRKLRLRPGQDVLDVGCGWGGFALFAAEHYGVNVTGVTLSREQASWAEERVAAAGLRGQVAIRCQDYRSLEKRQCFDAVVSVGMSEHVGAEKLKGYFSCISDLLKPGGIFLNHAIGEGCRFRPSRGPSFIDEYVFPDSDIPPIESVMTSAASAGFEIRDIENLREHYALTLRHWVRRLESSRDKALEVVNEATYRVWRLYMAGSALGFEKGRLAVYQALLVKPDQKGHSNLPLTRQDWYLSESFAGGQIL